MSKMMIIFLLTCCWLGGCREECVNCDEDRLTISLYIHVTGTAKDSVLKVTGLIYNEESGTRYTFETEKKDSLFTREIIVDGDIKTGELGLTIYLKGEQTKNTTVPLSGIDFTGTRIALLGAEIRVSVLDMEVVIAPYTLGINQDLQ